MQRALIKESICRSSVGKIKRLLLGFLKQPTHDLLQFGDFKRLPVNHQVAPDA
jgi:hypothetical protein